MTIKQEIKLLKRLNPNLLFFEDLEFNPHPISLQSDIFGGSIQSRVDFKNGSWVSIISGLGLEELFELNKSESGEKLYEFYSSEIEDTIGNLPPEEVSFCLVLFQTKSPKTILIEKKHYGIYYFYETNLKTLLIKKKK